MSRALPPVSVPRALALMVASGICFSAMSAFVKLWATVIPLPWFVFFRSLVMLLIAAIWGFWSGRLELKPKGVRVLGIRGVAGFFGITSVFYSASHLPLPIASVLNWCSPLFVIFLSSWFLREKIPPRAFGFVGIAFLALTQVVGLNLSGEMYSDISGWAVAVALGGAAAAGVAYTAVRAASARFAGVTIVFHFGWIATCLAIPWILSSGLSFEAGWLPGLLAVGFFASFGQMAMTQAFRWAPAPAVSTMSLLNAPFSAVFSYVIFGELLHLRQWIGIVGLIFSIAAVGYLQHTQKKKV